jgi:hypothetical protein
MSWSTIWLFVLCLWLVNAVVSYLLVSKVRRAQGQEPPSFISYLFLLHRWKQPVTLATPVRVALGVAAFVCSLFFLLLSAFIFFTVDISELRRPLAASVLLVFILALSLGSFYMGTRVIRT